MFNLIKKHSFNPLVLSTSLTVASLAVVQNANATIVEFQTSLGNIQVNLFDEATPNTVENFINYVTDGHYDNTVVHRVVDDFVVQGGGYEFSGTLPLTLLGSNEPVVNEPIYSNVAGTIAMAKIGGQPNSATDEWFFNMVDNSANLDAQNGGFTVFGQVIGDGMQVLNEIASLGRCGDIPISDERLCDQVPGLEDLAVIESITIIDSSVTTASELFPLLTKYPDSDGDGVKDINDAFPNDPTKSEAEIDDSDSGAGGFGLLTIFALALISLRRRTK